MNGKRTKFASMRTFSNNKGLFGSGFLLSEKAAAEKVDANIWELSDREREIIKSLGK